MSPKSSEGLSPVFCWRATPTPARKYPIDAKWAPRKRLWCFPHGTVWLGVCAMVMPLKTEWLHESFPLKRGKNISTEDTK